MFDLSNYDWWYVAVSGVVGAFAPGWGAGAKGLYPKWLPFLGKSRGSGGALKNLSEQASRAKTANRAQKLNNRIRDKQDQIVGDLMDQGVFQYAKGKFKDSNDECEDKCKK